MKSKRMLSAALLGVAAAASWPALARAQEVTPTPARTVDETTWQATGPSWAMVGSGIGIFGVSYLPAVLVGATSSLGADQTLYVPIVGPWMDLGERHGCPVLGSCSGETTSKVLLVTDGVVQAVGALTVVGGLLTTAHERRTVRTARSRLSLELSPARIGGSGYGVVALGRF